MKSKHFVSAAMVAGFMGAPAWAASVVFDFSSPNLSTGSSFGFTDAASGVSVQARGYEGSTAMWVTQSPVGLGVLSAPLWQPLVNQFQVDGVGGNEAIQLKFSRTVALDSLTFNLVDGDDNIKVSVLDPTTGLVYSDLANGLIDPAPAGTQGALSSFTLDLSSLPNRSGLVFGLSAKDPSDNFAVAGVKATYFTPPSSGGTIGGGVAVPLPSAAWAGMGLFAMAIGFPAIKRRTSRHNA